MGCRRIFDAHFHEPDHREGEQNEQEGVLHAAVGHAVVVDGVNEFDTEFRVFNGRPNGGVGRPGLGEVAAEEGDGPGGGEAVGGDAALGGQPVALEAGGGVVGLHLDECAAAEGSKVKAKAAVEGQREGEGMAVGAGLDGDSGVDAGAAFREVREHPEEMALRFHPTLPRLPAGWPWGRRCRRRGGAIPGDGGRIDAELGEVGAIEFALDREIQPVHGDREDAAAAAARNQRWRRCAMFWGERRRGEFRSGGRLAGGRDFFPAMGVGQHKCGACDGLRLAPFGGHLADGVMACDSRSETRLSIIRMGISSSSERKTRSPRRSI